MSCRTKCIYREKEVVIVTCPDCDKPRLIQHRSHWGNTIPKVVCSKCAQNRRIDRNKPERRLKDFEECLEILEIAQSFFNPSTPLMVRTPVNAMLRAYKRGA